ncbi:MAG: enoyl-CoA hydratase-related protein [Granulosicoccus sp.]
MAYLTTRTDDRGVTTLTLNRPDQYNALDRSFLDEFKITLDKLGSNTRILVIAGAGKHFCAGADINWMKQSAELSDEENQADAMALSDMLDTLNSFSRPTIARVQGAALGGGTGLVCCCDIVVASESAKFAFSEVKLGIMPATISPYALAAIGARAARRYFLTAEHIDAVDAYRLGLVHDVCSTENLDHRVEEQITALLQCAPLAQSATKKLINDVAGRPIDKALRESLSSRLADIRAGEEAQEGLGAFLDKRPPPWN